MNDNKIDTGVPFLTELSKQVEEQRIESSRSVPIYKDSIGSYKDRSIRSIEEYKRIHDEMGDDSFTIEDMMWIDMNVVEDAL